MDIPGFERRYFAACDTRPLACQARAEGDTTEKLRGYAAVFDSASVDFGDFIEVIKPGAFTRTLKERPDVRALVDHDTGKIIARTASKTMSLIEDSIGLLAEIIPAKTTHGRDILESVSRGDVTGMSIGFVPVTQRWSLIEGRDVLEVLDVELYEVSFVAFPAYEATTAQMRDIFKSRPARRRDLREREVQVLERLIVK